MWLNSRCRPGQQSSAGLCVPHEAGCALGQQVLTMWTSPQLVAGLSTKSAVQTGKAHVGGHFHTILAVTQARPDGVEGNYTRR